MPDYVILFVIATALWYFLFVRMSSYKGRLRGKVLYWSGDFVHDRRHSASFRALVAVANVLILYLILMVADWIRSNV
jgi:hypothetical protein